jgi:hypothetical protein
VATVGARLGEVVGAGAIAGAVGWSRSPQPPQNFSPRSVGPPHEGHAAESTAPHSVQKRRSGRFSWLQDGQCIACLVAGGVYHTWRKYRYREAAPCPSTTPEEYSINGARWSLHHTACQLRASLAALGGWSQLVTRSPCSYVSLEMSFQL